MINKNETKNKKLNINIFKNIFKKSTSNNIQKKSASVIGWNYLSSFGSLPNHTKANITITPQTALQSPAVYSCMKVISETLSSLSLHLYKKTDENKELAKSHPLYDILNLSINKHTTSQKFIELIVNDLCLYGNHYSYIVRNSLGVIQEILPLDPKSITITQDDKDISKITYEYKNKLKNEIILKENIFHIVGFGSTSAEYYKGISIIEPISEIIGQSIAQEQYASLFFKNNATPSAVFSVPQSLNPEKIEQLRTMFEEQHSNENIHKPLIVEDGAKLEYIKKSDLDTQFLSSREFVNTQICGAFRVPPHLIANLSKSSFSNITEQSEELVKYTLRPFIKNIEKSINLQLLSKKDQKNHYCKFNLDSLLRGTPKARADYYSSMRNIGAFSINDIRALENLNKIAQGDDYTSPLNSNQTTQDQKQENTTTSSSQKENTTTNE